jgi:D-amino-acid oxidase
MSSRSLDVLVIGAGVSGLTTAICLAEAGSRVAILAGEPPLATTSMVAGALWGTHLVGLDERTPRWADETHAVLMELAADGTSGVHVGDGIMAVRTHQDTPPEAPDATVRLDITQCEPDDVPDGYETAWHVTAPLISMPDYLGYLESRRAAAGVAMLEPRRLDSLAEAAGVSDAPVIVNCPGSGAYRLVPDETLTPVRGQIVVVANPGFDEFFVGNSDDPDDLCYIFPHGDTVVVGGTQEHGVWSREPDPATAEQILAAAAAVQPLLKGATVLGHRVGLRPSRPFVRLEAEAGPDGRQIVHNYGHGGAGVSLSWGCAREAAGLARAAL